MDKRGLRSCLASNHPVVPTGALMALVNESELHEYEAREAKQPRDLATD